MNFFEHQDEARRSTKKLVVLFVIAVILLILITNIALVGVFWFFDASLFEQEKMRLEGRSDFSQYSTINFLTYIKFERVFFVSAIVVSVVGFVILMKRHQLSGGGKVVAESLGGKKVDLKTNDFEERQILNIVEEMALASGVPVPPVYILEEKGINAFAAGYSPSDAVIGISRGCIHQLNRDELQGVVAHEFSHILNGDMRLNIDLIAVLAGILFIGHAGWFVVRTSTAPRRYRSSRDSGVNSLIFVGFILVVIGFIGAFFGKLIKAAVSRQREFLADASAVQFTRNPRGIAGALKQIGASQFGSRIQASHVEEVSHLFFSNAINQKLSSFMGSFLSTHPPLHDRIKRIEPRWNGKFPISNTAQTKMDSPSADSGTRSTGPMAAQMAAGFVSLAGAQLLDAVEATGEPCEKDVQNAQVFKASMNEMVTTALKDASSARAFIYLLLLNSEPESHQAQMHYLEAQEEKQVLLALNAMDGKALYQTHERLNLLEMAMPALREMSYEDYRSFLIHVVALVRADKKIDLFEWLLHSLLIHYLKPNYEKAKPVQARYKDLSKLRNECRFLLSHLTHYGEAQSQKDLQKVFATGFQALDLGATQLLARSDLKLDDLNNAVHHFAHLYPLVKPRLLKACAICIQADGVVTVEQYELLRAISALIDCPMPTIDISANNESGARR